MFLSVGGFSVPIQEIFKLFSQYLVHFLAVKFQVFFVNLQRQQKLSIHHGSVPVVSENEVQWFQNMVLLQKHPELPCQNFICTGFGMDE